MKKGAPTSEAGTLGENGDNAAHLTDALLDTLLDAMRPYFDQEREWLAHAPLCETDADLLARQRYAALLAAHDTLRAQLEALLNGRE